MNDWAVTFERVLLSRTGYESEVIANFNVDVSDTNLNAKSVSPSINLTKLIRNKGWSQRAASKISTG